MTPTPSSPAKRAVAARRGALIAIKVVHTVAWAFFAGCIVAIPIVSWLGHHVAVAWLIGIVFVEVAILLVFRWRCPLTILAGRFTDERHPSFDIYLPPWLALHNKRIFGTLFCLGLVFAWAQWAGMMR